MAWQARIPRTVRAFLKDSSEWGFRIYSRQIEPTSSSVSKSMLLLSKLFFSINPITINYIVKFLASFSFSASFIKQKRRCLSFVISFSMSSCENNLTFVSKLNNILHTLNTDYFGISPSLIQAVPRTDKSLSANALWVFNYFKFTFPSLISASSLSISPREFSPSSLNSTLELKAKFSSSSFYFFSSFYCFYRLSKIPSSAEILFFIWVLVSSSFN